MTSTAPRTAATPAAAPTGFVRAQGGRLVDGTGRPVLLRGVGLGGWLLPEGYMLQMGPRTQSPRQIEALVERLVGRERADEFWRDYRDAFVTEADVARIAACGMDHVRVPVNARVVQGPDGEPLEDGYRLLDRLVAWCRTYGLRVLLDLHGAPGGQTGTNIDDSPRGLPELFMDRRYRDLTLRLWTDMATRYADEPTVLGYDLLNEPLPNEWQHRYPDQLVALYRDLTARIREVDAHHLLVYEGPHWSTTVDIFTQRWDDNSCLQFHKYWSPPDEQSISHFLRARDRLGLPLYMGEGGENEPDWLYTAFRLYESQEIGWNLWTWKKLDAATSPVSVTPPDGWGLLVASEDGTPRLDADRAGEVLDELLANLRLDAATWQPDVLAAATGERPPVIPAWGYGFRGPGESYEIHRPVPFAAARAADRAALVWAYDGERPENPFEHVPGRARPAGAEIGVRLEPGDWLEFELTGAVDTAWYVPEVLGGAGDVRLATSARGIRATARTVATLLRIVRRGTTDDDEV